MDVAVPSDRLCFPKYSAPDWNITETRTDLELKSAPTIRGDFKLSTVVCFREFYMFQVCNNLRPYLEVWCKC